MEKDEFAVVKWVFNKNGLTYGIIKQSDIYRKYPESPIQLLYKNNYDPDGYIDRVVHRIRLEGKNFSHRGMV